ncbi:dihydrofolate reductase family protein [Enterococcus asini]|uniref:dihydrofolate reductase family protein n=1 Tax=Enterococcus asini TaxID=57732 RepID=UPI00266D0FE8|nr:dihydrofolate reductase family protein [Enterococcus asini]
MGLLPKKDGSVGWLETERPVTEVDQSYEEFYAQVDTVLMGRKTYEQLITELSPVVYPYEDAESYIFTSKPEQTQGRRHFVNEAVTTVVKKLREQPGGVIWIVGGSSIVDPLISANLIDEYIIAVIPRILGAGVPLFRNVQWEVLLTQTDAYTKNGLTYLCYKKKADRGE